MHNISIIINIQTFIDNLEVRQVINVPSIEIHDKTIGGITMNELYFEGYGYFKTNESDAQAALDRLMEVLAQNNLDFIFEKIELRNEDGEKIDD